MSETMRNILLATMAAFSLAACGGGGAPAATGGTAALKCPSPPAKLTGVQTGTMQVAVLYKSYDGVQSTGAEGVYVMIDDGGPSARTDACGYATISGLTPGPHDVFVFADAAGPLFTKAFAVAQTDRAHVEVPMYTAEYGSASSLYAKGAMTGGSGLAEFHYDGNKVVSASPAVGNGTHTTVFATDKPQGAQITGNFVFRKTAVSGSVQSVVDAFESGPVTVTTSDIFGLLNRVDNPLDVTFAPTPPALNLTLSVNETTSPNIAGVDNIRVYSTFGRAMESVPNHGRSLYYEIGHDTAPPFAINMYALPSDQFYVVAVGKGANTGWLPDIYPGDAWTVVEPVPAGGAIAQTASSFASECNAFNAQTGTTFAFTPATGTLSYHKLEIDMTKQNGSTTGWTIWMPDTATSFTLPANLPAGAADPAANVAAGSLANVRLSCVDAGGMTYAQFVEGQSLIGKRIEEYKLYGGYYPY